MSTYQIPHGNDLITNAKLPGQLAEDMQAISYALNDIDTRLAKLSDQVEQLQKDASITTEYITDTNVNTDNTIDVPTSTLVNDGGNGDELSGLMIEEQKGEN